MKFTITLKDPDCVHDSVKEAVDQDIKSLNLPKDELDLIREARMNKTLDFCRQWIDCLEYVELEMDTDAKTCIIKSSK